MAASFAELPGAWAAALDRPPAGEAMDFSRAASYELLVSDGAGTSGSSQAGSLPDSAQLACSPSRSSTARSSMSSLGSFAGTPKRQSEQGDGLAQLAAQLAREGDAVVKLTSSRASSSTAADCQLPAGLAATAAGTRGSTDASADAAAANWSGLLASAPPSLDPLPLRAASSSLLLAPANSLALGPQPASRGSSSSSGGPPPDVLLAALAASLQAKQQQEQHAAALGADAAGPVAGGAAPVPVPRGAPTQPACACPSCHMVFADVTAYQAHCASQEHSVNIVHASLAMSLPRVASATTGIPQLDHRQLAAAVSTAAAAPAQPPPAVPMPVRSSGAARALVRSPSAPSGLGLGFAQRSAAELFSELRLGDTAGSVGSMMQRAPSMHSMASMPLPSVSSVSSISSMGSMSSMTLPSMPSMPSSAPTARVAPAPHLSTASYSGPCLTPCCDQVVDPQLDAMAQTLLKQLRQLDGMERAGAVVPATATQSHALASLAAEHGMAAAAVGLPPLAGLLPSAVAGDPSAAALAALPDCLLGAPKPARRLVGGLREVRKAVKNGTAVAVVAAVDIQTANPFDRSAKPADDIAEICELARARGVAVVFALSRIGLGSVFGTNKRMSAVALTNISGMESPVRRMLQLAEVGRAQWAACMHARAVLPHA